MSPRVVNRAALVRRFEAFGSFSPLLNTHAPALSRTHLLRTIPSIPPEITRPPYIHSSSSHPHHHDITTSDLWTPIPSTRHLRLKSPADFQRVRDAARIVSDVLHYAGSILRPGITTIDIDRLCHERILTHNAYPSPLGFDGFPASICTSVNNVACHGIPDSRPLEAGDIISIDCSVFYQGVHGDKCVTYLINDSHTSVDEPGRRLVDIARKATRIGIESVQVGRPFSEIGKAIKNYVTSQKCSVVEELCGHGIGRDLHELPYVYHTDTLQCTTIIQPGMTFTIEPIITQGLPNLTEWEDGWTLATVDCSRAAQFEEMIGIDENGSVRVLTDE